MQFSIKWTANISFLSCLVLPMGSGEKHHYWFYVPDRQLMTPRKIRVTGMGYIHFKDGGTGEEI